MKPKVLSLFSGCGGMDLGFISAGFEIVWANDFDKDACITYKNNIGEHINNRNIKDITDEELPRDIDVVIGGFPCQGFSLAGKRDINDDRNELYKEMKRVISVVKPKVFVAENVRGLLSMSNGKVIEHIVKDFSDLGYKVNYKLLYAPDYGVPQERYRVIIVGNNLNKENTFPEITNCNNFVTIKDTIYDIIKLGNLSNHQIISKWPQQYDIIMQHIKEGQKLCNSRHSSRNVYTWDIPEVYGETTSDEKEILLSISKNRRHKTYGNKDGNPLSIEVIAKLSNFNEDYTKELIKSLLGKEYLVKKENKYDITKANFTRFVRLKWDNLSPTILTNFDNPRNYIHPSENRPLSVREVARLQTFPDNFIFYGNIRKQYRQIGNAVPPLLAQNVAKEIYNMLIHK